jgi:RsiW-degrading membrane proteinase PrsW (M82 family)
MNPDNPYAAPQTLEPRLADGFPVAELAARNLFPELSTVDLRRLAAQSQAIDNMSMVWGVVTVFAGVAFSIFPTWYWLLLAPVAATRTWTGNRRTPGFWKMNLILDSVVALCLIGIILLGCIALASSLIMLSAVDLPMVVFLGGPLVLCAVFASFSARAHYVAKVLYGHYPHQALIAEVGFRKKHRII